MKWNTKLEELANVLHRKRAAILRYVMQWGLTHTQTWTVDPSIPDRPHLVHMLVEPELLQQVQEAAAAQGVSAAAWVREAMRRVSPEDFPASWRATTADVRTHDSSTYTRRFMLRLDETTAQKLQALVVQCGMSQAAIIRQLITQANPAEFPQAWRLAVREWKADADRPVRAHQDDLERP